MRLWPGIEPRSLLTWWIGCDAKDGVFLTDKAPKPSQEYYFPPLCHEKDKGFGCLAGTKSHQQSSRNNAPVGSPQKHGYPHGAEELWHRALFLAHETDRRTLLWQIHAGLADVADSEGLALVHYRIAGEVLRQIAEPIDDEDLRETFLNAATIKQLLEKSSD